jgi:hypothetical protein
MFAPTIKNLLDLHEDIRRKVDAGAYVVEVDQLPQLLVSATELEMKSLHSRIIELGPVTSDD